MSSAHAEPDRDEYDPVFVNSRREAIIIFFVWFVGLIWAVPFCYLNGYVDDFDPEKITASVSNGVLTVTLPRAAEAKPKKISVKAA